jgi:hypothetical protein
MLMPGLQLFQRRHNLFNHLWFMPDARAVNGQAVPC